MAHTQLFAYNLFYVILFSAITSLIPNQSTFTAGITISFAGFGGLGGILLGWIPPTTISLFDIFVIIVPIIVSTFVALVLISTKIEVLGSTVQINFDEPFKAVGLVIGIAFTVALMGYQLAVMMAVNAPFIITALFCFPSAIMMIYSLIMDLAMSPRA